MRQYISTVIGTCVELCESGTLDFERSRQSEEKIKTEESRAGENKTNHTNEQDSRNLCESVKKVDFSSKEYPIIGRFIQIRWNRHIKRTFIGLLQIRYHWSMGKKRLSIFGIIYEG